SLTPGNRIVYLYTKKVGIALKSTCDLRFFMRLSEARRHVSQAWIKCTFLIEDQKIIVKVLRAEAQSQKAKFKK
ncbi:hypothetical protein FD754_013997, partial [Muntiacus muntjak]